MSLRDMVSFGEGGVGTAIYMETPIHAVSQLQNTSSLVLFAVSYNHRMQ